MIRKFYDILVGGEGSMKEECELQYEKIKQAEQRLKELRAMCKHENTFEGLYSYRVGAQSPAVICSDCGSLIKFIYPWSKPNSEQNVQVSDTTDDDSSTNAGNQKAD